MRGAILHLVGAVCRDPPSLSARLLRTLIRLVGSVGCAAPDLQAH